MSNETKSNNITKGIGLRLKKARKKRMLKSLDFAKILDVSASRVSDWESGRSVFPAVQIYDLAKKLGVTPAWLLTGEGEMEKKAKEQDV